VDCDCLLGNPGMVIVSRRNGDGTKGLASRCQQS
jgi:hypothetical protein